MKSSHEGASGRGGSVLKGMHKMHGCDSHSRAHGMGRPTSSGGDQSEPGARKGYERKMERDEKEDE